ncbi:deoxyribodipyrimidine photo-lyase [Sphingobacteriales bacterium UPWRP_1]|nr:deoxyribodipyrimidine photolyase [Sphingobacteriales bacterium TSM_CSM]PSJ76184.1 deoxyribodipyrimidine photo-lyase [Sphingobacteriales bacterium UPWRP_1]
MTNPTISIHWFRRDLRWHDNTALWNAVQGAQPVLPLFIFDTDILNQLPDADDRRLRFIYRQLQRLQQDLHQRGSSLLVKYGKPIEVWKELVQTYNIANVYTNRDYEPYAQQRDREIYDFLQTKDIPFKGSKDHVIFEKNEILTGNNTPYTVFTPYSRRWNALFEQHKPQIAGNALQTDNFYATPPLPMPTLESMGFKDNAGEVFPPATVTDHLLQHYAETRNYPAIDGTSGLSVHFRFGTISIREMALKAAQLSPAWLNELIWRDFYQMILWHFPHVVTRAFKPAYDAIPWRTNEADFDRWRNGATGYPIVDAGMRQLSQTGFMHNRVRMITASFLTKHLLIDWRMGEAWFAQKLLDFELASNNGGWQWAASTGCDAAPYFRIFNPEAQTQKFDPQYRYIKQWVPEFGTPHYPKPIVDHQFARQRALETFKQALKAE